MESKFKKTQISIYEFSKSYNKIIKNIDVKNKVIFQV